MSIAPRPCKEPAGFSNAFVQRRPASWRYASAGIERRQFPNVGASLSAEAEALGEMIDRFKKAKGIKQIDFEDMLHVIKTAGYSK